MPLFKQSNENPDWAKNGLVYFLQVLSFFRVIYVSGIMPNVFRTLGWKLLLIPLICVAVLIHKHSGFSKQPGSGKNHFLLHGFYKQQTTQKTWFISDKVPAYITYCGTQTYGDTLNVTCHELYSYWYSVRLCLLLWIGDGKISHVQQ